MDVFILFSVQCQCFQSTLPGRMYNRDILLPYCKIYTLFKKNDCALSVKPSNTEMVCVELYKKKIVKLFSLRDISSAEWKND